ncbi:LCP family protein [Lolliginicoccus suaedae]|uniref:LCP family protein n=1 Tax=Lolliginicoccus suaedae TaxID=2605429 RepID=UPI001F27BBBA|nr:LCP family protein [Lolliginicoccus suaedae]
MHGDRMGRREDHPGAARPVRVPPRKRRRPRILRTLVLLLVVLAITTIIGLVIADQRLDRINALGPYPGRISDTPGTNFLLVGTDSRTGLTSEQEAELSTGGETGPTRTDTIMLLHASSRGNSVLVSIPRDSYVTIPRWGEDKVNAAYSVGGPALLAETIEQETGIRIDHYAEIGFSGFADVASAVGGVEVCLDAPIVDPLAGIDLPAGCQVLSGGDALGYVRSRSTPLADIDRMNNQRDFLARLAQKAGSPGVALNPFRSIPVGLALLRSISVDEDDHIWDAARIAWSLRGEIPTVSVPHAGFMDVAGSGNVLLWDEQEAAALWDSIARDAPLPEGLE